MTCDEARLLMHAYLDDELDAAQSAGMATHLQDCAACAAFCLASSSAPALAASCCAFSSALILASYSTAFARSCASVPALISCWKSRCLWSCKAA